MAPSDAMRAKWRVMVNDHIFRMRVLFSTRQCHSMGMSYVVIKTIGGHRYRYLQTSYRVGKKVKTKSVYLGPVRDSGTPFVCYLPRFDEEAVLREMKAEDARYRASMERFTAETGLKVGPSNPEPVEKATSQAVSRAPTEPSGPQERVGEDLQPNSENGDAG